MAALEASVRAARHSDGETLALDEVLRREDALVARLAALEHAIEQPVEADPALVAEIRGIAEGLEALQSSLRHVATTEEVAALGEAAGDLEALRLVLGSAHADRRGSTAEAVEQASRIPRFPAPASRSCGTTDEIAALRYDRRSVSRPAE
jgi:hypothetical protein